MIVELNTNFNDTEKSLLREWTDVDVKLYIDLKNLVDRFIKWDKAKNIAVGEPVVRCALDFPEMIPNRIICVQLCHWLIERKSEPDSWYLAFRSVDGEIGAVSKYDDLESALNSI